MDLTDVRVFLYKYQHLGLQIAVAISLLIAGFQLGRVTSPYYTASPIIFQDRQCTDCASVGGTAEELQTLKAQGQGTPIPVTSPVTSEPKLFVASQNSTLFHYKDCPAAQRIKADNQVWFATAEAAEGARYSPSQCAQEKIGNTK